MRIGVKRTCWRLVFTLVASWAHPCYRHVWRTQKCLINLPFCERADTMCQHTDNEESFEEPIRFSSASLDCYWRRFLFMDIQTRVWSTHKSYGIDWNGRSSSWVITHYPSFESLWPDTLFIFYISCFFFVIEIKNRRPQGRREIREEVNLLAMRSQLSNTNTVIDITSKTVWTLKSLKTTLTFFLERCACTHLYHYYYYYF